jgi:hypothetical protein
LTVSRNTNTGASEDSAACDVLFTPTWKRSSLFADHALCESVTDDYGVPMTTTTQTGNGRTILHTSVPPELAAQVREIAHTEDRSVSWLLRHGLEALLQRKADQERRVAA